MEKMEFSEEECVEFARLLRYHIKICVEHIDEIEKEVNIVKNTIDVLTSEEFKIALFGLHEEFKLYEMEPGKVFLTENSVILGNIYQSLDASVEEEVHSPERKSVMAKIRTRMKQLDPTNKMFRIN